MENIEYYQRIACEDICANKDRNECYQEIDDMMNVYFELPSALTALGFIGDRKFWSSAPRNAVMAAVKQFATLMPKFNIDPVLPLQKEYERVERMEAAIEWHFEQLNNGRQQSPLWKIVDSAARYCNVSMQTEYRPYSRKKKSGDKKKSNPNETKRIKQLKLKGDFNFIVHHPGTVHPRFSKDGLESVLLACRRSVKDLKNDFPNNKEIAKYVAELESEKKEGGAIVRSTDVAFFDYTDWTDRVIWFTDLYGDDLAECVGGEDDAYVIMNEPHELDFIPWVVFDNKEPLLAHVYDLWANLNIIKTITFAKHVALAGHPAFAVKLMSDTDDVEIDTSNPLNMVLLKPGQEIVPLPSPPIDPQLAKTEMDLAAEIHQSSSASILGSVERLAGQGDSFSSMNAVLQAALAQLSLVTLTGEQALGEGVVQIFRWINKSGEPLMAYRSGKRDEKMVAGTEMVIFGGKEPENHKENEIWFDVDNLYVHVKLSSQSITDEMARVNIAVNKVKQLGYSEQDAYEEVGGMDYEKSQAQSAAETLYKAEIGKLAQMKLADVEIYKAGKMAEIQTQQQAAMMQMQQAQMAQGQQGQGGKPAQPMTPQNANRANSAPAFAASQGMDTRGGGAAPQASAPGIGREQVNNVDAQGNGLA